MLKRLDASDIASAGSYLSRQLEQTLPKVYSKRYAKLWAQEGQYLQSSPTLEEGITAITEEVMETVGEAAELADISSDVPTITSAIAETQFNVHIFAAGYQYTVLELNAAQRANKNISTTRTLGVDRALRQKEHELLVFGNKKRGSVGLFNNPDVPVDASGYDPNNANFGDTIDYISSLIAGVQNRNNLTSDVATILISNKLSHKWTTLVQTNTGLSVKQFISDNYPLIKFGVVNECNSTFLEKYGIRPVGSNEDLVMVLPDDEDAVQRLYFPPSYMPPQLYGLTYKVISYCGSSQTIWHYPDAAVYSLVPSVTT